MPINVFGNSNANDNNKINVSLFVQKSYLRSIFIESDIDHDVNLKNQNRIKNLANPISNEDGANKKYSDKKITVIIKKTFKTLILFLFLIMITMNTNSNHIMKINY